MKVLIFICFTSYSLAKQLPVGSDYLTNVSLDEFDDHFHHEHITNPVEKAKHEKALKESQEIVKKANEAYARGEQSWYDEINEFAENDNGPIVDPVAKAIMNLISTVLDDLTLYLRDDKKSIDQCEVNDVKVRAQDQVYLH